MLRTPAEPVRDFDAELRKLVKDLTDTMLEAPGLGLAAPQIGVGLRVFTYFVDDELGHLINPSLDLSADEETDDEGCLSFPGLAFPTKRAFGVVAKGFNMYGDPVTRRGHRPAGPVRAARDRPSRRRAVHRPARPGAAQAGDEPGHPRSRVVGRARAGDPGLAARDRAAGPLVPMRLVFAGTPQAAVPALDALLKSASRGGRGGHPPRRPRRPRAAVGPSPVAQRAAEAGVEVLKPARPRDPDFTDRLRQIAPDCVPITAYGALIPQPVLDIPAQGWVNLHFSLLPAWRGAAPVQHAILHGDDITGATTFRLVKELDAGPVFGVVTEPIRPRDTAGDLLGRLAVSGADLLVATLDGIESGQLEARPQPAEGSASPPRSPPGMPGCAGTSRPSPWTGRSAPAPPARGPGPCWGRPG